MRFEEFGLDSALLRGVQGMGFDVATPIQVQAIPPALEGRDLLACAMTGSGKTAAFMLPILNRLLRLPRGTTRVLVLTPTRELAAQIQEHLREMAKYTPVKSAAVFGGVGMKPQETAFRNGVDVLIATPGRLLDHLQYDYASLGSIEHLVLDEADRMLDMGFLPDVKRILSRVPRQRQTLLFSATMPAPIASLSREFMHDPVRVNVERKSLPATGVTQALYPVRRELKTDLLAHLLDHHDIEQVLVFTRTKHRANRLAEQLVKRGFSCERIHGNRSQNQRTQTLAGFKDGSIRVLIATDIVARGIDVEALGHVINYDVPNVPDDYIHRVGRTARAELTGEAYTFMSQDEEQDVRSIERAIGKTIPRKKAEGFDYDARVQEQLEVPLKDRIAAIRARKAEERARSAAKVGERTRREADELERRNRRQAGGNGQRGDARRAESDPGPHLVRDDRPARPERPARGPRPERGQGGWQRTARPAGATAAQPPQSQEDYDEKQPQIVEPVAGYIPLSHHERHDPKQQPGRPGLGFRRGGGNGRRRA